MAAKKQTPTPGRIVLYQLTYDDMIRANERSRQPVDRNYDGFDHTAGQRLPMIVTSIGTTDLHVFGQVFLNGNATLFVRNAIEGDGDGEWHWPPRS